MTRESAFRKAEYQAERDKKPQAVVKAENGLYLAGPKEHLPSDLEKYIEEVVQPRQ